MELISVSTARCGMGWIWDLRKGDLSRTFDLHGLGCVFGRDALGNVCVKDPLGRGNVGIRMTRNGGIRMKFPDARGYGLNIMV